MRPPPPRHEDAGPPSPRDERLVIEWGGSALHAVDRAFAATVLHTTLCAVADSRLACHAHWLLSVSLVDDAEIEALNHRYRGVAAPTDVLSFSQLDAAGAAPPGPTAPAREQPLVSAPLVLGDIVVSAPRARAQAADYGHSLDRELGFLLVHGVLHLLGHDHEHEDERRVMRREEERILALLSLTREAHGHGGGSAERA